MTGRNNRFSCPDTGLSMDSPGMGSPGMGNLSTGSLGMVNQ